MILQLRQKNLIDTIKNVLEGEDIRMDLRTIRYLLRREVKKIMLKLQYGKRINIGRKVGYRNNVRFYLERDAELVIGDRCFFNNDCSINVQKRVEIGENTLFGEGVKLYDHNHIFAEKDKPIFRQGFRIGEIHIGANCWICSNCVILKGVHIGDNCVIGAGCIISEDVPDNTIVRCVQQLEMEARRQ